MQMTLHVRGHMFLQTLEKYVQEKLHCNIWPMKEDTLLKM